MTPPECAASPGARGRIRVLAAATPCDLRTAALAHRSATRRPSGKAPSLPAAPAGSAPNYVCRTEPARFPGSLLSALAGSAPNRRQVRRWSRPQQDRTQESRHRPSRRSATRCAATRRSSTTSVPPPQTVRAPLRSGTRAACWFCAQPGVVRWSCSLPGAATTSSARRFCAELSARATPGPATAGAAVKQLASTEPAATGAGAGLPATGPAATELRAAAVAGTPSPGAPAAQVDEPALDATAATTSPVARCSSVTARCCAHVSAGRAGTAAPRLARLRSRFSAKRIHYCSSAPVPRTRTDSDSHVLRTAHGA